MRASRALAAAIALVGLGAARCDTVYPPPPACRPIDPIPNLGAPPGAVWGFADLHSHPAIELAFNGDLIWGTAKDDGPINASQLPAIEPCPVETHNPASSSPIDCNVGAQVFPQLSRLCGFAHGPVGSIGYRPTTAWPNARDIIHQQMNVSSIRRAYEGGLRLMIAATTDNQAIAALLTGPNVANGFVPDPEADYRSARAQLDFIDDMVERNRDWMGIARTPKDARDLIGEGRLAIILSLEMDGLRTEDVEALKRDYGVRHVFPVHLVDNANGGTAANGDLFNAASSAVSSIYRSDHGQLRYMDVRATNQWSRPLGWPVRIKTLTPAPFYAALDPIAYSSYSELCYEPLGACAGTAPIATSFLEYGQENARGLCSTASECASGILPGQAVVHQWLTEPDPMFVDLSHMSAQSVADTLAIAPKAPLMASHGGIAHLCVNSKDPACVDSSRGPTSERALDADAARQIVSNGGVIGLGSGVGSYDLKGVLASRGGPVFTLDGAHTTACVARPDASGCVPVPPVDGANAAAPIDSITLATIGGIQQAESWAQPFLRVEMRAAVPKDQFQRHVLVKPITCTPESCNVTVPLGTRDAPAAPPTPGACDSTSCATAGACTTNSYTVDDIQSVTVEWLYLGCDGACHADVGSDLVESQCRTTWDDDRAPLWTIDHVDLGASSVTTGVITDLATLGTTSYATLGRNRGQLAVYSRDDRPSVADADGVLASGHLMRIAMRAGPNATLLGASPEQAGANVCVALRQTEVGRCVSTAAPPPPGATECPPGWTTFNQRGEWDPGVELYTFVRGDESSVCGVDVSVLDWPATNVPFAVDEIRVEALDDPIGHWVRSYADVSRFVAGGRLGALAFGTDFNGLNGMLDISEFGLPPKSLAASACPVTTTDDGAGPGVLAPMRIRNADGSLGTEVRIDERGLSTYGMLADFVAIAKTYPGCGPDVYHSLMLSAEATIRAWELLDGEPPHPDSLPTAPFECKPGVWSGP